VNTGWQSSSALWVSKALLALTILTALLMLSTFVQFSPGFFFAFVLLNGIFQAAAGSYLQTSIVAIASLFGPSAMQAVMSGQAAVAVVVSSVQVVTAAMALWGIPEESIATFRIDGETESNAACVFFGLSTVFLVGVMAAHRRFVALPVYGAVVESRNKVVVERDEGDADERHGLVSGGREDETFDKKTRILLVAKTNIIYEIAVAFVFIITLVSESLFSCGIFSNVFLVSLPANHDIHPPYESCDTPIPIQRHSFPSFQRGRLPRTVHLRVSPHAHLVRQTPDHILLLTHIIHSPLLDVQRRTPLDVPNITPTHQF
jgi:equilibrative nucleoside transporter 1/2/3